MKCQFCMKFDGSHDILKYKQTIDMNNLLDDETFAMSFDADFRELMEEMSTPSFFDSVKTPNEKRKCDSIEPLTCKRRISLSELPDVDNTANIGNLRDSTVIVTQPSDSNENLTNSNIREELKGMRSLLGVMADGCMHEIDTRMEIRKNHDIIANLNDEMSKDRKDIVNLRAEVSEMRANIQEIGSLLRGSLLRGFVVEGRHARVPSPLISNVCGSSTNPPKSYTRGEKLQCRHCTRTFTYAKKMREHYAEEHPLGSYERDFVCTEIVRNNVRNMR